MSRHAMLFLAGLTAFFSGCAAEMRGEDPQDEMGEADGGGADSGGADCGGVLCGPADQGVGERDGSTAPGSGTFGPALSRKAAIVAEHARAPMPGQDPADAATVLAQMALAYAAYVAPASDGGNPTTGNTLVHRLYVGGFPRADKKTQVVEWPGELGSTIFMRMAILDSRAVNAMSAAARAEALAMVKKYVQEQCTLEDDASAGPWSLNGTENHQMVRWTNCLLATYKLKDPDHARWAKLLKAWLVERARAGLLDEMSPQYAQYTLAGIYNLLDFRPDTALRNLAKKWLDLYWHDAAHDFNRLTGIQGAAGSRLYQPDPDDLAAAASYYARPELQWQRAWLYVYGWHDFAPAGSVLGRAAMLTMATSSYVPLEISHGLATLKGKSFEYASRRPSRPKGAWELGVEQRIRRDVSVNDDFTSGAVTYDFSPGLALPHKSGAEGMWYTVSSNSSPRDRLLITGESLCKHRDGEPCPQEHRSYADWYALTGTVSRDVILAARSHVSENSRSVRVWIGEGELRTQLELPKSHTDWFFTRAGQTYLALRVPDPGLDLWSAGQQVAALRLRGDIWAPIVVQAARASSYASFEAFKAAVRADVTVDGKKVPRYSYTQGTVTYTSLRGHKLSLSRQEAASALPRIEDHPLNMSPVYSYQSPFLSMSWPGTVAQLKGPDGSCVRRDFATTLLDDGACK